MAGWARFDSSDERVITSTVFTWKNGTRTTISASGADVDIEETNRKNGSDIGETVSYEEAMKIAQDHVQFASALMSLVNTAEENGRS